MDPSDMTLQAVLDRLINDTQFQTGAVVDEIRIDQNIYRLFVDEVNETFVSGMGFTDITEYKGVKITPVTEIGTLAAVVRIESKINYDGEQE